MRSHLTRVAGTALAAGALAAACGGGDEPQEPYELAATRTCLEGADVPVTSDDLDFVASTALGGAVRARFADNSVTLAFGESPDDAGRIASAYRNFAGPRIPMQDVLLVDRNGVMLWEAKPAEDALERMQGCLADG